MLLVQSVTRMANLNIEDLPPEILIKILSFLPVSDRLELASVSRTLLNASQCPALLSDILVDLIKPTETKFFTRNFQNFKLHCKVTSEVIPTELDLTEYSLEEGVENVINFEFLDALKVKSPGEELVQSFSGLKVLKIHEICPQTVETLLEILANPDTRLENVEISFKQADHEIYETLLERLGVSPTVRIVSLASPLKSNNWSCLQSIQDTSHLVSLEIASTELFQHISGISTLIPNLKVLTFAYGFMRFPGFDIFEGLPVLEVLKFENGIRIIPEAKFCSTLSAKSHMRVLEVTGYEGKIDLIAFERLMTCFSGLTDLHFSACHLEDEHFLIISKCLPRLLRLNLDYNLITDKSLARGLEKWPELRKLSLAGNYKISDAGFESFPPFYDLRSLTLNFTPISDRTLNVLVSQCPALEELFFGGCQKVTDDGVKAIVEGLRRLRRLEIFKCVLLTDSSWREICQNCKKLKFLDVSGLDWSEEEKDELYRTISSLKIIYDFDNGVGMAKYIQGRVLKHRELHVGLKIIK